MENLKHTVKDLSNGGFVLVLDTGAKIDPQAEAMIQALHSRSTGGIHSHLSVLRDKGAENFMEKFYVGYGHKSIGDCGRATIFVEGVSMLAAKAIQDWRLYSGQEASTRYIDFSEQTFINPLGTPEGEKMLEDMRTFYLKAQKPVQDHLKSLFPREEGQKESVYEKAITARAFDITRGLLPAGASTNVAWSMNLRQFADELMLLRHHPLAEVQEIAEKTEAALFEAYPQSFGHKRYDQTEAYNQACMQDYYYHDHESPEFELVHDGVNRDILKNYRNELEKRPAKTELPPYVADSGILTYDYLLDFGSFRDIQRHRAVVQRMPLLTIDHGFEPWYLESFPPSMLTELKAFLYDHQEQLRHLKASKEIKQYYTAMGYRISCRISGDIRALVYLGELRATRFVHPTLVKRAGALLDSLEALFGEYGLVIHRDDTPNQFDVKRGEHDIVIKEEKQTTEQSV
ncbi:FAD-dependent thymidylate synthase [Candidatus Nomurabacteria bacterium]|nr:FAD-dependent thymidylate synthase [Candidatus Nomurabacteria bacterium]